MPVTSGYRRTAASAKTKMERDKYAQNRGVSGVIGKNEIDNHADTICAGSNWIVLEFTGEYCNVSPFSAEYEPLENVPIAQCATVYTYDSTGATVLLIADQVLWFGDTMATSLINPHQLRDNGIGVCDDPWDPYRPVGIEADQGFIPFSSHGTTLFFESRSPSPWELENLPTVLLTAPRWSPHDYAMPQGTVSVFSTVRSMENMTVREPFSETDCVLGHISPALDTRLLSALYSSTVNIRTSTALHGATTGTGTGTDASGRLMAAITGDRHTKVNPENLARLWNIGLETAKRTLQVTTQQGIRTALHPLHRRYRVDHLHLNRRRLNGDWFTDTLFSKIISLQGNTCAQVYTNGNYTSVHPMTSKSRVGITLTEFSDDVGIPDSLTSDGAMEMVGPKTEFTKEVNRLKVRLKRAEVGRSNQNYAAEREIGELKKRWRNRMIRKKVPKRLWDYGLIYEAGILNRIPRGNSGRTGLEIVTGETPDISEWIDFEFYDRVWFYDHKKIEMDSTGKRLARWLGIAHRVGSDLCYWLLLSNGKVLARTTVQHVTREDMLNDDVKVQINQFDEQVEDRLTDENFVVDDQNVTNFYLEDDAFVEGTPNMVTPDDVEYDDMLTEERPERDEMSDELTDKYIGTELIFGVGLGNERRGRVTKRAKGLYGDEIGRAHTNPLFDTREYVVEFTDGTEENYFANVIAENMFAQVDGEGRQYLLMEEITDHRRNELAVKADDGFVITRNGNKVPKKTTTGWELMVTWKDGSSDWIKLKDIKDSYPVQVAEYAVTNRIAHEPAFNWWVHDVLRKRNRIISKVKSKYWKTTHKFGVRVPKTVEEALQLDDETNTDLWRKALGKEMSKVKVAWKSIDDYTPEQVRTGKAPTLIGYQEIKCHVIFDVKMDFTRKARFVAGGHMTETPESMTYSSVVSRDSIRIAFLIAGLNDLDVLAGDVTNAYLNAPCREKIWFEGKLETGADSGKVLVLTRALYGLKSSGAAWRADLAGTLRDLGFTSTQADPDVWIKQMSDHYEMVLVYVDDILIFSRNPKQVMDDLGKLYEMKPESVREPELYLGANMEKVQLPDGRSEWAMTSRTYVKNAVKTVENLLAEDGEETRMRFAARNPFPSGYRPELDATAELHDEMVSRFLQLIGILRWAVELGRLDIYLEVSQLSQHQALPRQGHLDAAYHIFAYLRKHENGARIVFDPKEPVVDIRAFNTDTDWTDFYGNVVEELPPRMPEPKGKPVMTSCFVDANHAGNVVTRRSHTGILLYVNNAPVQWYSKRQNTVESSSFGSEFVALRVAKEMIVALRYKLRMFGVPISGATNVFCDNNGVVKNASIPHSMLQKKHNAINYHAIREAVAAGILRVGKEDGMTNLADLFTKVLTADRRRNLCRHIMY
jgi:Reverse transcriptase (RNA-dependent DNA polymerase)